MDARAILDGLIEQSREAGRQGIEMAEQRSMIPPPGDQRSAMLKGAGAGALAAGAVAMLFGSKKTRKFVGKAARLGGTAALGGLAYHAWQQYQAQAAPTPASEASFGTGPNAGSVPSSAESASSASRLDLEQFASLGVPLDQLEDSAAQDRSEAIIQAMISAARADGHIDDRELQMIKQQIDTLGLEQDVSRFLLDALNQPVSVDAIATLADSRETAAELYLASALVVDIDSPEERRYLDALASAMDIDQNMIPYLEAPLRQ